MPDYKLSRAADRDLTKIYTWTYQEFGEAQTDAYFQSMDECLQRLANYPKLGVSIESIRTGYRRFSHKRHAVYYLASKSGIMIVRILGPGQLVEK